MEVALELEAGCRWERQPEEGEGGPRQVGEVRFHRLGVGWGWSRILVGQEAQKDLVLVLVGTAAAAAVAGHSRNNRSRGRLHRLLHSLGKCLGRPPGQGMQDLVGHMK